MEMEARAERASKALAVNVSNNGECDVYVGRRMRFGRFTRQVHGYFGNPFSSAKFEDPVGEFKAYFLKRLKEDPVYRARVLELKGKRLGCWCLPNECHASVIADWVNRHA